MMTGDKGSPPHSQAASRTSHKKPTRVLMRAAFALLLLLLLLASRSNSSPVASEALRVPRGAPGQGYTPDASSRLGCLKNVNHNRTQRAQSGPPEDCGRSGRSAGKFRLPEVLSFSDTHPRRSLAVPSQPSMGLVEFAPRERSGGDLRSFVRLMRARPARTRARSHARNANFVRARNWILSGREPDWLHSTGGAHFPSRGPSRAQRFESKRRKLNLIIARLRVCGCLRVC